MNPNPEERLAIVVIDNHELILEGTVNMLRQRYPQAKILIAKTAEEAREQVFTSQPSVVSVDLSIPEKLGMIPDVDTGLQLLQALMKSYPSLNLVVQTSHPRALIRIKHDIENHQGGFTIADKDLSETEMLNRVNWSMQGLTHTKDLKMRLEVKPEWLEVLQLAFEEGLQDKAIAKKMHLSERMVRHYWAKIQDVLEIYPEEDKNLRVLTFKRAREEGLID